MTILMIDPTWPLIDYGPITCPVRKDEVRTRARYIVYHIYIHLRWIVRSKKKKKKSEKNWSPPSTGFLAPISSPGVVGGKIQNEKKVSIQHRPYIGLWSNGERGEKEEGGGGWKGDDNDEEERKKEKSEKWRSIVFLDIVDIWDRIYDTVWRHG